MDYPYNSAIILTDAIFIAHGGRTGTVPSAALHAAYFIAEKEMSSHLHTLLTPTDVTGTYLWATASPFQLDYGYVHSITAVTVESSQIILYPYNSFDLQKCVLIRDEKRGLVDVLLNPLIYRTTTYPYSVPTPYKVFFAYNAGLPSGTVYQDDILWALTMAAQLVVNEMDSTDFLANETPGGIGVQEFTNELYTEKRVTLGHSIFGSSPVAQQITRIMAHLRCKPVLRFH